MVEPRSLAKTLNVLATFTIVGNDISRSRAHSHHKERLMRKLIVGAQVSIDGVMQAPGGPSEDPTKGFRFGGWVMPYFDEVFGEEIDRILNQNCDLLLGRKTYEIFAAYWPYYDETDAYGGIAKLFKDIKKY